MNFLYCLAYGTSLPSIQDETQFSQQQQQQQREKKNGSMISNDIMVAVNTESFMISFSNGNTFIIYILSNHIGQYFCPQYESKTLPSTSIQAFNWQKISELIVCLFLCRTQLRKRGLPTTPLNQKPPLTAAADFIPF